METEARALSHPPNAPTSPGLLARQVVPLPLFFGRIIPKQYKNNPVLKTSANHSHVQKVGLPHACDCRLCENWGS